MSLTSSLAFLSAAIGAGVVVLAWIRGFSRGLEARLFQGLWAVLAGERLFAGLAFGTEQPDRMLAWHQAHLVAMPSLAIVALAFSAAYSRDHPMVHLRRWLPALVALTGVTLSLTIIGGRAVISLLHYVTTDEHWIVMLGWAGVGLLTLMLLGSVLTLINLERTYRAATGAVRWRIKYMILGVGLLQTVYFYTCTQSVLFRHISPDHTDVVSVAAIIAGLVVAPALWRSSRTDSPVYIGKGSLLNSLTLAIAGLYLLVIGFLAQVVSRLGGDATFALKAFLILLALVVASLAWQSDRVRQFASERIKRHLQRPEFDYRSVWLRFIGRTSECVDPEGLCRTVAEETSEVMETLSVSIWLLNDSRDHFSLVATTAGRLSEEDAVPPEDEPTAGLIAHFERSSKPISIERRQEPWAALLQLWHPNLFPHGGDRIAVPLVRQKDLMGIMTLGDRVNAKVFSAQDFDILTCIADHSTACLLNLRLGQRLVHSRELEAFQTMATFFVHDLKNSASTLSLMLKNLPVHFDDPEFRQDALRGIEKTVGKINRLIGRMSQIRHELELEMEPVSLAEIVKSSVASISPPPGFTVEDRCTRLPPVPVDREQISKVITNLILNAVEASTASGELIISNRQERGGQTVTFQDNGCGMTEEFIRQSLYRPFCTTKASGLGIGMFQSRMIIEKHGGRISVRSEPGAGTTFQIHLPERENQ